METISQMIERPEVRHFDSTSTPYAREYDLITPDGFSFRSRRENVLQMLPDGHNKHILDLASGPGVMIKDLRKKGFRVTCVDAAPGMIEIAKTVAPNDPMVTCEVGDAYSLRFEAKTFDVVTAMGLIEYLHDEEKFLKELYRVTKPGGMVIITLPNVWSPWRIWNRMLRVIRSLIVKRPQPLLHREYTVAGFRSLLRNNKFDPYLVSYYNMKLVLYPFDRLFPRLTARLTELCEWMTHTPLKFMATGFIVASKHDAKD